MMETAERSQLADLFGHEAAPDLQESTKLFLEAREEVLAHEMGLKIAKDLLLIREQALVTAMAAAEVKSSVTGNSKVVATAHTSYNLNVGDLSDANVIRWILLHGGHDLIRRSLDTRGFSALCREVEAKGMNLHPKIKSFSRKVLQVRRNEDD